MTGDILEFVVYIIHRCAAKWHMAPNDVYKKIQSVGCVSDYLVPMYDILHTQSSDFVVSDVEEYLWHRGVRV
ncbi:MAG: DUF3791 domain-containing protein [Clostridia bacterium]|nr:DUF3791 domain-containing protein [Clostridia bacterium]